MLMRSMQLGYGAPIFLGGGEVKPWDLLAEIQLAIIRSPQISAYDPSIYGNLSK
jgi:hypothetical protein